jgi:hypothetical protein
MALPLWSAGPSVCAAPMGRVGIPRNEASTCRKAAEILVCWLSARGPEGLPARPSA